jgi:hypothetical protein
LGLGARRLSDACFKGGFSQIIETLFLQIYTLERPYKDLKSDAKVIMAILRGIRPNVPKEMADDVALKTVVEECWQPEPSLRPTADKIFSGLDPVSITALKWSFIYS